MLTGELRGKVGVAPGTTTLVVAREGVTLAGPLDPRQLTEEQYRGEDVRLRERELDIRRKEAFWNAFASFGTATLSTLALLAALGAWLRTGRINVQK